uniref:Uncharacterized protein n=1 Tax=Ditylenchus dipsaci TaxID=166011 RepID=A0A915E962_9BILA
MLFNKYNFISLIHTPIHPILNCQWKSTKLPVVFHRIATGSPGNCQWNPRITQIATGTPPNCQWHTTKLPDAGDGTLLVIWWTATGN